MKYKKILKTSRRGENIYSASTINADTIFKSPISLSLEYLASKAFEANSFQRWNRELTSALQFFWVNKLTSSGKHSKLPSLRSTIFMGLKNSRSFDKVAFCFARKRCHRNFANCVFQNNLAIMDGWRFKMNFNV